MRIRAATAADIEAIAAIYGHHVRTACASFEIDPPDAAEMARRHADIVSRNLPYLAADLEGVVTGFAYAGPYRTRPAYQYTVEDSIYIHPGYLGRGLGKALLSELIAQCEIVGARQMIAVIGDSANAASIRLHASFGFRHVGVLESVGFKFGRWVDIVLMQSSLGSLGTRALTSDVRS